jgi:ATP-binding cassette, sub-family E, member 1
LKPGSSESEIPELSISYKPQKIAPKFEGTVRQLLLTKIPAMFNHPAFKTDVLNPLNIENIIDFEVLFRDYLFNLFDN